MSKGFSKGSGIAAAASLLCALGFTCAPSGGNVVYVDAVRATEPNEEKQLDVAVVAFSPGFGAGRALPERAHPQLLLAEANYLPNLLRTTMEGTRHWSAVNVVPEARPGNELTVEGEIRESNGLRLALQILAYDATGRTWLSKGYATDLDEGAYAVARSRGYDPYQPLLNAVANDLVAERDGLSPATLRKIRAVAEMRFAADLVPDAFAGYVERDRSGNWQLARLPAEDDPMSQRVGQIRERDAAFLASLSGHYAYFSEEMDKRGYFDLRQGMMTEERAYQATRREANLRQAVGLAAIVGALAVGKENPAAAAVATEVGMEMRSEGEALSEEAEAHREGIAELVDSFDAEVAPLVLDVRGETVRLTGTATTQYQEWRKLLAQLYRAETGMPDGSR